MPHKPTRFSAAGELLPRRKVLRGLGALAVSAPALSVLGRDSDGRAALANSGAGAAAITTQAGATATKSESGGAASQAGIGVPSSSAGHAGDPAGTAGQPAAISGSGGQSGTAGAPPVGGSSGQSAAISGSGGQPAAAGAPAVIDMPKFDDAASCTLTTTDIEGPFYIDESEVMNDESMIRSDVRESQPGCEFRLFFRVMDARKMCAPMSNIELYIWHCNASGYYSGFSGQDPSKPYAGSANPSPSNLDRFLRGVQYTDDSGIANFTTIYPGWYAGRQIHLHLMGRIKGQTTRLITTQLYFPAAFSLELYQSESAYVARSSNIPTSSLNPPSGKPAIPTLQHTPGLVVGTLNVIVDG